MSDFNARIIDEFRANDGRVGDPFEDSSLILIHHIGAKSEIERVTPLGCFPQPDGRLAIVASNGGSDRTPDWYYNLKAHPEVNVEFGTERFEVAVRELEGTERERVWVDAVKVAPGLGAYQNTAGRRIPVLLLTRIA
jgi:deazaflavin-dependent oxidoreductase (nitroreductase family)